MIVELNGMDIELNPMEHGEAIPVPKDLESDTKDFLAWHHACLVYYTMYMKKIETGEIQPNRIEFIKNLPTLCFTNG